MKRMSRPERFLLYGRQRWKNRCFFERKRKGIMAINTEKQRSYGVRHGGKPKVISGNAKRTIERKKQRMFGLMTSRANNIQV
jgi:hypothetical protein